MLSKQNANEPKGQIANGETTVDITADDQILHAADYKDLVVGYHKGAAIKLSDIAEVNDSVETFAPPATMDGKPCVMLIISRQPGANIIETVDRIREAMPSLEASVPAGIKFVYVLDRTTTIRASVNDVERTLVNSIVLVILVALRLPAQCSRHADP